VYLHYALDLWFEKVVKKRCHGEACLRRYADDLVCAFEEQEDAAAFSKALGERLGKCLLALAAEKTRISAFSRHQTKTSFEFLGFEFRWGKDRSGKAHLKRRTARKKLPKSLANFTEWCKKNRHLRLRQLFERLNTKLRGYDNYYGVKGNYSSFEEVYNHMSTILMKWLNRRSQRRSVNWQGFKDILAHGKVPRPRITERPRTRQAASQA
jgi:RNA-directed DNA polymerase